MFMKSVFLSPEGESAGQSAASEGAESAEAVEQGASTEGAVAEGEQAASLQQDSNSEQKAVEEKKTEDKFSTKFLQLQKKEKALLEEKQAFKAERDKLQEKLGRIERLESLMSKKDYDALLKEIGTDYNALTEHYVSQKKVDPEVAEIKAKLDALEREKEEADVKAKMETRDRQVTAFKSQISEFASTNGCEYLMASKDGIDTVYSVIELHWQKTMDPETGRGTLLSIKEACDLVEKDLESEVEKLLNLDKTKKKLTPAPSQQRGKAPDTPPQKSSASGKTLNNSMTASSSTTEEILDVTESKLRAARLWK